MYADALSCGVSPAAEEARAPARHALVPPDERLAPLAYSREQAAQLLGISLATLDRRVMPTIATVKTEWGARLIPVGELERYLAERREDPRARRWSNERSGRKPSLPSTLSPVSNASVQEARHSPRSHEA